MSTSGLNGKVHAMAGKALEAQKSAEQLDRDNLRAAAARLYGQGMRRTEIAAALLDHLVPNGLHRPRAVRMRQARRRLKDWEASKEFRDLIWQFGLIQTDLRTGDILHGLVNKAVRGRVDAAKLALELTGRYTPKGEQQPTQVAVVFTGISRSSSVAELVQADVEEDG